jgi:hypothetical protein
MLSHIGLVTGVGRKHRGNHLWLPLPDSAQCPRGAIIFLGTRLIEDYLSWSNIDLGELGVLLDEFPPGRYVVAH